LVRKILNINIFAWRMRGIKRKSLIISRIWQRFAA